MAETYTIKEVSVGDQYDFTPPGGKAMTLQPYDLLVEGPGAPENQTVQLNQVPETPVPEIGSQIFGDVTNTKHGWRIKKVNPDFAGNGGGGGRGQSKANVAGQRWSSCLEKGATLYEYGRTEGVIDKPNNLDDIVTAVALLAGKLQATYPAEANE